MGQLGEISHTARHTHFSCITRLWLPTHFDAVGGPILLARISRHRRQRWWAARRFRAAMKGWFHHVGNNRHEPIVCSSYFGGLVSCKSLPSMCALRATLVVASRSCSPCFFSQVGKRLRIQSVKARAGSSSDRPLMPLLQKHVCPVAMT